MPSITANAAPYTRYGLAAVNEKRDHEEVRASAIGDGPPASSGGDQEEIRRSVQSRPPHSAGRRPVIMADPARTLAGRSAAANRNQQTGIFDAGNCAEVITEFAEAASGALNVRRSPRGARLTRQAARLQYPDFLLVAYVPRRAVRSFAKAISAGVGFVAYVALCACSPCRGACATYPR